MTRDCEFFKEFSVKERRVGGVISFTDDNTFNSELHERFWALGLKSEL